MKHSRCCEEKLLLKTLYAIIFNSVKSYDKTKKMVVYGQISIGVYFEQFILYRKSFESDDCSFLSVYFLLLLYVCVCVWGGGGRGLLMRTIQHCVAWVNITKHFFSVIKDWISHHWALVELF